MYSNGQPQNAGKFPFRTDPTPFLALVHEFATPTDPAARTATR